MQGVLSLRNALHQSYKVFCHSFKPVLLFDCMCKAFSAVVLLPLLTGIINLALKARRMGFAANSEIVSFLISPMGLLAGALLFLLSVLFACC